MPTREEMIAALRAEQGPSRKEMIAALKGEQPQVQEEPSMGDKAFDYAMRALDYAGGVTRTGIAELADLATDEDLVREGDWEKTFRGQAPTTSDILQRAGAEPGIGTAAAGFVGDIVLDPTTYLSGGATAVPKLTKLQKLMNPVTTAADKVGDFAIRSGVKNVDKELAKIGKGEKTLGEFLIKEKITGTMKNVSEKTADKMSSLMDQRNILYKNAEDAGAAIDTGKILDEFTQYIDDTVGKTKNIKAEKNAAKLGDELLEILPDANQIDLNHASNIKTQITNDLPDSFYDNFGNVKDKYKEGVDKIAKIFKDNIEESANRAVPGSGNEIARVNKEWSNLKSADKFIKNEIKKGKTKDFFTSVDAMILTGGTGYGMSQGDNPLQTGLGALFAKKMGDLSKTTVFRTNLGKQIKATGRAADPMIKRGLINLNRDENEAENR